jgi:hypothetical protein
LCQSWICFKWNRWLLATIRKTWRSKHFNILWHQDYWSDKDESANYSIHVKCEFDLNVIHESDWQFEKQFVLTMMAIQMKLMKMSDNVQNSLMEEFQHCWQSKWIQVMKMKMQLI